MYATEGVVKDYHDAPGKDKHAAARLQAPRVLAGVEFTDAQSKAEAFKTTRHFWRFEIGGWDGKMSLKDVEGPEDQDGGED